MMATKAVADLFDVRGRGILVTGGNAGIGLSIATVLADAGAQVVVWGSNAERNADLNALGTGRGISLQAIRCDIRNEDDVEDAVGETVRRVGPLRACFANAGVDGNTERYSQMSLAEWHRVLAVNLDGTFLTLRAVTRHMIDHGLGGSLVATSSLAAFMGKPKGEHYAATKGAVISMMASLSVELGRYNIRANTIVPGWVETAMFDSYRQLPRFDEVMLPRIPARRWGRPEDFAGVALYLASDASAYHTGDTLVIDGGLSRT